MKPRIPVVAAVFFRWKDGAFELALFQRKAGDHGAGLWEFPGGKVERGESKEQALVREIQEELSLDVQVLALLGRASHELPAKFLDLDAFWVKTPDFNWTLNDHDGAVWVNEGNWNTMKVAPLDIPLIKKAFEDKGPRP
jgi:mutator protein MutT